MNDISKQNIKSGLMNILYFYEIRSDVFVSSQFGNSRDIIALTEKNQHPNRHFRKNDGK